MNYSKKPVILISVGHYLPGYKAGGILRTIINIVDHLCDEFEFRMVTRDRDLGDDKPYADIKLKQWQQVGNAVVRYLSPQESTIKKIFNLIVDTPHHMLYLNSFFDPLTIKVLLIRKFYRITLKPVIVAPRGEFAWASLKQKYLKKFAFIQVARILGLYKNIIWHASSEFEAQDIMKIMKIQFSVIHIARDLPLQNIPKECPEMILQPPSNCCEELKIVFLSRIAREKNLDYALRILNKVKARVAFDIYGPVDNVGYWKECKKLMSQLPANVKVNYLGTINPDQVIHVLSHYDLFLFPTGGENYGHVIAESLTAGTPVLISTKTPWRNLQADSLGWDIDLAQEDSFVKIIEKIALLSNVERGANRTAVKANVISRLLDPAVLETNRQLFKRQLLRYQ